MLADYWKGKVFENLGKRMRIIVVVRETERNETILSCEDTARLEEGGNKLPVTFTYERCPDGEYYHDIRSTPIVPLKFK